MILGIALTIGDRNENAAQVFLSATEESRIQEINGEVRGPFCGFSGTLPADFLFAPAAKVSFTKDLTVQTQVLEPCYWTPQLPFWYECHVSHKTEKSGVRTSIATLGLRRWTCEGNSFHLQLHKTVLRGVRCESPLLSQVQLARDYQSALLVDCPDDRICEAATKLGVPLVADLRKTKYPIQEEFRRLDWYPAVLLVILSKAQLTSEKLGNAWPRQSFVALCIGPSTELHDVKDVRHDLLAVELHGDQLPQRWVASCGKPVIGVHTKMHSTITGTRNACDRFQASLAPNFSLAGYFV
jgi:hypothetical protein